MNFAQFNLLEFNGGFPQFTIASWLPTFPQLGRLIVYAAGTTLAMGPTVGTMRSSPGVPDPWRSTSGRVGPDPRRGTSTKMSR